jgi:hypothetical protein
MAAPHRPGERTFVTDVMAETGVMGEIGVMGETGVIDRTKPGTYGDEGWASAVFTDDELTALALAADPDAPLAADAIALPLYPDEPFGALPAWYMPPAMARVTGGWRRVAVFAIIAGFLVIDAFGLCITYGQLVAA